MSYLLPSRKIRPEEASSCLHPNEASKPIPPAEDSAQVAGQKIEVFDKVKPLYFLCGCRGKPIGRNPFQEKGGFLLRKPFVSFYPWQEISILRAGPLTVKTSDQTIMPGRIDPRWERDIARLLVKESETPFCPEKKGLRTNSAGRTTMETRITVLAPLHHL
jgi:hypothetical protein